MKFRVVRSSDSFIQEAMDEQAGVRIPFTLEVDTIEQLMEFQKDCNHPLIITPNRIEIYDDWRE